jgi:hypothetical protein
MVSGPKSMSTQIQILSMGNFQHKHKKIDSNLFLNLILEAFMLPLNFDELNIKFEKL